MIISALKTLTWATVALAVASAVLQAGVGSPSRPEAAQGEPAAFTPGRAVDGAAAARGSRAGRSATAVAPPAGR